MSEDVTATPPDQVDEAPEKKAKKGKAPSADVSISSAMNAPTVPKVPAPSVGRIVHFRRPGEEPLAAVVSKVVDPDKGIIEAGVFVGNAVVFKTLGPAAEPTDAGWVWPPKV